LHQGTTGPIHIADTEKGRQFGQLLEKARFEYRISGEMEGVLYGKLLLNLNNAISALSGLTLKRELETRGYRELFAKCIWEALDVYRSSGIQPVGMTVVPPWLIPYVLSLPDFLFHRVAASQLTIDEKGEF
jgi:2-dehydropantoate 2-reductase